MKSSVIKLKPTLESLLSDQKVITGKKLLERKKLQEKESERQKVLLEEAIEFERRNRKVRN